MFKTSNCFGFMLVSDRLNGFRWPECIVLSVSLAGVVVVVGTDTGRQKTPESQPHGLPVQAVATHPPIQSYRISIQLGL